MTPRMHDSSREQRFFDTARARGLRPVGRNYLDRTLRGLSAFFSRSLLREDMARRPGVLQAVDPRVRLVSTLLFLVSISLAQSIPVLLAHAVLPCLAITLSRIRPREFLSGGFLIALIFSSLMAAPATLNVIAGGQVVLPLLSVGQDWRYGPLILPHVIGVSREGLLTAATFLLRVLTSVAAVLWLTLTTRWMDLLRSLRFLRFPPIFLQVIGMTVRYLHMVLRHSEEIHLGKKSRTLCHRPILSEQAWVGSRLANAWERGLHLMGEVSDAMKARGFTGEARFPPDSRFGVPEWVALLGVGLFCGAAHVL
jgi:cobalt/nickel transport system permease protein